MVLLHHVARGSGSLPLVFVHGFACAQSDWQAQVDHFSRRHQTVVVDLPGHGKTAGVAATCRIEQYGAALADLLRELSLQPAVLIGHSMGCRVVLEATQIVPERVVGVVLLDGSRFAPDAEVAIAERFAAGEYPTIVRGMFEQMFTATSDPVTIKAVVERALTLPPDIGQALLPALMRYDVEKLATVLEKTSVPLLALQTTYVDENRRRAPLRAGQSTPYLELVRAKVPHAHIEILPGVGHFPQLDAPGETNRIIEKFLAKISFL